MIIMSKKTKTVKQIEDELKKKFGPMKTWDWKYISRYQRLSEPFIEKHADKVDWYLISKYHRLSEPFIEKHADDVDWEDISIYQRLSEPFIEKHRKRLFIGVQRRKHKAKTLRCKKTEMRRYAREHGLAIEKDDDGVEWLYAYREHNFNGSGAFRKNIYYEPRRYYHDWHCDMDAGEINSFGLGIWPEGNTPVRVKAGDWGVAVKDRGDGKARVWGFEVIA